MTHIDKVTQAIAKMKPGSVSAIINGRDLRNFGDIEKCTLTTAGTEVYLRRDEMFLTVDIHAVHIINDHAVIINF